MKDLIEKSEQMSHKEKPCRGAKLLISGNSERENCELLWKDSKVLYFAAEDEDIYEAAMKSDWKCFCGSDPNLTADEIINLIKEKKSWR